MAVPIEEVNDAITFEQSTFSKSTSQKPWKYRANSVSTTLGQQGSRLEQLERQQTQTHTQTDYCNPAAHAQMVNNLHKTIYT